jgi:sterol 3beta-glucosyltransferase
MRVTMLSVGSRGDVQPLIAFGLGLEAIGHDVRLATYPSLEPFVTGRGLEFAELAEGALSVGVQTAEGRRWAEKGQSWLPTWVGYVRDARSVAHRRLVNAAAACEGADVIVASNLAQVLGFQMSNHFAVPLVRVLFHAPTYWMSNRSSPRLAGALRQLGWVAARPWLNSVRREAMGLERLPLREPVADFDRRNMPVLYPFSTAVFPVPAGWDHDVVRVTGYWFLDGALDAAPPAELIDFLRSGPPPVYIGFGTQLDTDPPLTTRIMIDALRRAEQRSVLVRPREALAAVGHGDDVFALEAVSHAWLFPQCAAVVHHSASGTTAAGLRAGVPTVPVPHNSDQFSWARRLHQLGVGSPPIPRRRLSAARLADAIKLATTDEGMRRRAAALGETIAAERGVDRAVELFQDWFGPAAGQTKKTRADSASSARAALSGRSS